MKKLILSAVLAGLVGCVENPRPFAPRGERSPIQAVKGIYEIIWVQGTYKDPDYGLSLQRFITDKITYEGDWMTFRSKRSGNVKVRLRSSNVIIYGGDD